MPLIESLTPEQEALIPIYREKWRSLILSTERMDRRRAEGALRAAYTLVGSTDPQFQFFNGPQELQEILERQSSLDLVLQRGKPIPLFDSQFFERLQHQFTPDLWQQLMTQLDGSTSTLQHQLYYCSTYPLSGLFNQLINQIWTRVQTQRRDELSQQPGGEFLVQLGESFQQYLEATVQELEARIWQPLTNQPFMQPFMQELGFWNKIGQEIVDATSSGAARGVYPVNLGSIIDFCSSILDFSDTDIRYWITLRSVFRSCGIVMPFENICWVIERPTKILLNAEGQIHGDEEPAVTFADGSEFYAQFGDFKDLGTPEVN